MNNLIVTEFKNTRVLTTQQLAESYETTEKVISNNFNNNKVRYQEGKHYILLKGEDLKQFLYSSNLGLQNISKIRTIYLWTEKGAFLHAKSLNTDKAWEVYDILVDTYFKVREQAIETSNLSSELQMFQSLFNVAARMELETKKALDQSQQALEKANSIKDIVALNPTDWRKETTDLINRMAYNLGGCDHIRAIREESYKLLEQRYGVALSIRLTNKKRRMAEEGICKSKRDKLSNLDVIAEDKKLVEGYTAIIKEMAIKYGVA